MMKPTKKPAAPISKPSPGLSTPRVYKPASKPLLCLHHNLWPTKSSCLEKRSGSSAIRSSSYGLKSNNTAENKQTKGAFQIWCNTCREGTVAEELEAGVIDAKDRRDSLNPKAKPMQSSLPVRTTPKGSSEKVL
ncbi:hypothetical protein F2Q68_00041081 [Brassica cretica]|uniref:Uncharacterized protein n=1 Tax=Brassica cretica TaxID=69181 RepID=A0A8S9MTJ9_BRACR|nr:hypothetical protein F2Q68_00041081 [Brassica cretica]